MRTQLYIYGVLVIIFIGYNQFFQAEDPKVNTIINILFGSILFLYIAYMAFLIVKKMKSGENKK